jgi:fructose-1,6-bisphosphatase I
MHIGTTLTNYIIETQRQIQGATGEFTGLLNDIAVACKKISDLVNKGDLIGVLGSAGSENIQGETQKKLDVITNEVFLEALAHNGHVAGLASEEMDEIYQTSRGRPARSLPGAVRPPGWLLEHRRQRLGGDDLLHHQGARGRDPPHHRGLPEARCRTVRGRLLPVRAVDHDGLRHPRPWRADVHLDKDFGEFLLTHEDVKIPEDTAEFAINASNSRFWEAPIKRYVDECLAGKDGPRGKDFNMRWIASMVAEVHRILTRGGVFLYPVDEKLKAKGQGGKLRLMYEANPMGLIIEQAGGACTTGRERILSLQPEGVHQRVPVILGSKNEVERITGYHAA